ncbi:MAG: hypothetical protein GY829_04625 [Gammaproteobacteria bacterium]|nr:hypothetical protein [Gammaproteobacteria bacterium]
MNNKITLKGNLQLLIGVFMTALASAGICQAESPSKEGNNKQTIRSTTLFESKNPDFKKLDVKKRNDLFTKVQAIFQEHQCASCHAGSSAAQGLVLTPTNIYNKIVDTYSSQQPDKKLISPYNSKASYLLKKIRGDSDILGIAMPIGGPSVSPHEIEVIANWIDSGAKL